MGFIDDIKEDQKMQIQALCVVFFLLAFPSYFFLKAAATDDPAGMGGVGTYSVTGEFSYIDFDNPVKNTLAMALHLFSTSIRMRLEFRRIMARTSLVFSFQCPTLRTNNQMQQADTISGTATHLEFTSGRRSRW